MKGIIKTFTGARWNVLAPRPEDVSVTDLANALSRQCRFNGHIVPDFYSVAQHAVLVAHEVWRQTQDPNLAYWALHHDADECYLGDMIRPVKSLDAMAEFRSIAMTTMHAVCIKLGLRGVEPEVVDVVDKRMCGTEQRDLTPPWNDASPLSPDAPPYDHILIRARMQHGPQPADPWDIIEGSDTQPAAMYDCWWPAMARRRFLAAHATLRTRCRQGEAKPYTRTADPDAMETEELTYDAQHHRWTLGDIHVLRRDTPSWWSSSSMCIDLDGPFPTLFDALVGLRNPSSYALPAGSYVASCKRVDEAIAAARRALNMRVTDAIMHAERLPAATTPEDRRQAFAAVCDVEEQLAMLIPAGDAEGEIARVGAVSAALDADDVRRAIMLAARYLDEGAHRPGPSRLRDDAKERLVALFPRRATTGAG